MRGAYVWLAGFLMMLSAILMVLNTMALGITFLPTIVFESVEFIVLGLWAMIGFAVHVVGWVLVYNERKETKGE